MAKLTSAEKKWVTRLNKLLAECPSDRIGSATIGDCNVMLFDATRVTEICNHLDRHGGEFISAAISIDAAFDENLNFPNPVESTAG